MLSRTADSLFWMARYMERAEHTARLIDMGRRMAATPCPKSRFRNEWPAVLSAAGIANIFFERHPSPEHWTVIRYLMLERENPSSVAACFDRARANARSARGALTVEMWRAVNDAWVEMRTLDPSRLENGSMSPLLDWVKERSAQFRGAAEASVLRNDGYDFLKLGFAVERMDNTARLLDVKTYMAARRDGGSPEEAVSDPYEWIALLRAAGVLRAYHLVYRASYAPTTIVGFLTRNRQCPRALLYCAERISESLGRLGVAYGARPACLDKADALGALIDEIAPETVFDGRLSATLSEVIRRNNALSVAIADSFHFAPRPAVDRERAVAQADDQEDLTDILVRDEAPGAARRGGRKARNGAAAQGSQSQSQGARQPVEPVSAFANGSTPA